jgi:hypothetical protein
MEAADFKCEHCGNAEETLNVHHKLYRRKAKPWEYETYELACLCEPCHEAETDLSDRFKEVLAILHIKDRQVLLGHAIALVQTVRFLDLKSGESLPDIAIGSQYEGYGFVQGLVTHFNAWERHASLLQPIIPAAAAYRHWYVAMRDAGAVMDAYAPPADQEPDEGAD